MNAQQIQQLVRKRLVDEIGSRVVPNEPKWHQVEGEWQVPLFCVVDRRRQGGGQRVFVGNAVVDSNGVLVKCPTRQEVVAALGAWETAPDREDSGQGTAQRGGAQRRHTIAGAALVVLALGAIGVQYVVYHNQPSVLPQKLEQYAKASEERLEPQPAVPPSPPTGQGQPAPRSVPQASGNPPVAQRDPGLELAEQADQLRLAGQEQRVRTELEQTFAARAQGDGSTAPTPQIGLKI